VRDWLDLREKLDRQNHLGKSRFSRHSRVSRAIAPRLVTWHPSCVYQKTGEEKRMPPSRWAMIGLVALGIAVAVYLIFFCPAECR